jgi:hypothetical protein
MEDLAGFVPPSNVQTLEHLATFDEAMTRE